MSKKIMVEPKNVYGRIIFYPACDFTRVLCQALNKKCVPSHVLEILKENGWVVEEIK